MDRGFRGKQDLGIASMGNARSGGEVRGVRNAEEPPF